MKLFGTILIATATLLNDLAAEDAKSVPATNVVVITTDYINRLVGEARTNNPLKGSSQAKTAISPMVSSRSCHCGDDRS